MLNFQATAAQHGHADGPLSVAGALEQLDGSVEIATRALEAGPPVAQVAVHPQPALLAIAPLQGVEDVLVGFDQARDARRIADDDRVPRPLANGGCPLVKKN